MPVQGRQRAAQLKPNSCPLVQEAADLNPCPQTKLCFASSHETESPEASSQTEFGNQREEGKSTLLDQDRELRHCDMPLLPVQDPDCYSEILNVPFALSFPSVWQSGDARPVQLRR